MNKRDTPHTAHIMILKGNDRVLALQPNSSRPNGKNEMIAKTISEM